MLKKGLALALVVMMAVAAGCATNIHKIGSGPAQNQVVEQRQWYVLFGLVPINNVDTQVMAGGATNYEIKTQASVLDVIINIFTNYVTVSSRTVTVTK